MKKQVVSDEFYYALYDKIDDLYDKVSELGKQNAEAYDVCSQICDLHRWIRENTDHSFKH